MRKIWFVFVFLMLTSGGYGQSLINLEDIVIAPSIRKTLLSTISGQMNVMTSEDIEALGIVNTVDALRYVSGVVVRDWFGNGTKSSIDLGGFGETAGSNTLVLVDGRRVNAIDLSGVDWNMIPVERIERIEVLQSGQGAVLYGNNAVSGVVNIITKDAYEDFEGSIRSSLGSDDFYAMNLSLGGKRKNASFWIDAHRDQRQGYRDNGFSKTDYFLGKTSIDVTDRMKMKIDVGVQQFRYGMPGALFQQHIKQFGRRYTRFPDDKAEGNDAYIMIGMKSDFDEKGFVHIDVAYQQRKADSFFIKDGMTRKDQAQKIMLMPTYEITGSIFDKEHHFVIGGDFSKEKFFSDASGAWQEDHSKIIRDTYAVYVQQELNLTEAFLWMNGYRHERVVFDFYYRDETGWNPLQNTSDTYAMNVFNSGFVFKYTPLSKVFFNVNRSFRFPASDEFFYWDSSFRQQLDTGIKPQVAQNYELGVRHADVKDVVMEVSLFRMNIKDELYLNYLYDVNGSRNQNYDQTVHEGVRSSLEWQPWESITLLGQYTWKHAYFNGGVYDKNHIPLVPEHQASLQARWQFHQEWSFNVEQIYIGKSFMLNDQDNQQQKMDDYWLTHVGMIYRKKDITVTGGIKNLFNQLYAEYMGWDRWSGDIFSYPSPERTYYITVEYRW